MSDKLPEIKHLRGLGDPMFFSFNIESEKSKILICHAAIMGTFILPPDYTMSLCKPEDDPRLPHFIDYLERNEHVKAKLSHVSSAIDELEKELDKRKQTLKEMDKLIAKTKL